MAMANKKYQEIPYSFIKPAGGFNLLSILLELPSYRLAKLRAVSTKKYKLGEHFYKFINL